MRAIRKRRLQLVLVLMFGAAIAIGLIMYALRQNINLFFTPAEIAANEAPVGQQIRVGGLVVPGSVLRSQTNLYVEFTLTDTSADVRVAYEGILPDLFREGQGIVAIGALGSDGVVQASQVLAKHDENYTPPEVQKAIEAAGHPGSSES